mgnify:CR=1 FL=1
MSEAETQPAPVAYGADGGDKKPKTEKELKKEAAKAAKLAKFQVSGTNITLMPVSVLHVDKHKNLPASCHTCGCFYFTHFDWEICLGGLSIRNDQNRSHFTRSQRCEGNHRSRSHFAAPMMVLYRK